MPEARAAAGAPLIQIVTCAKSSERRLPEATALLGALGRDVEVDVVNGYVAEDGIIDTLYDPALNGRRAKRPISRTEIAVYASHRLAWRRLLDGGHAAALVFEDDFGFSDPRCVAELIERRDEVLAGGCDIVKLFDFRKNGPNAPAFSRRVGGLELVKWRAPTAGMVGYLISRAGAEKFLSRERIFRQIDEDTKYFWELDLDIWSVPGNPVIERSGELGGSVVGAERESMKIRRLKRSIWGNLLTADRKIRTRYHLMRERMRQG